MHCATKDEQRGFPGYGLCPTRYFFRVRQCAYMALVADGKLPG